MMRATIEWRNRRLAIHTKQIQERALALGVQLELRDEHVAILVRELALIRIELDLLAQSINGLAEWKGRERAGVGSN